MRDSTILFPKAYKSIQVTEDDGKSASSIRHITYSQGSPVVKESIEKIDGADEEKKVTTFSIIAGDLTKYYKNLKGVLHVNLNGVGSIVKWACEFEKASDYVPDPHLMKDFVVKNIKELDEYLLKA